MRGRYTNKVGLHIQMECEKKNRLRTVGFHEAVELYLLNAGRDVFQNAIYGTDSRDMHACLFGGPRRPETNQKPRADQDKFGRHAADAVGRLDAWLFGPWFRHFLLLNHSFPSHCLGHKSLRNSLTPL